MTQPTEKEPCETWEEKFDKKFTDRPIDIFDNRTILWMNGTERGAGTFDVKPFIRDLLLSTREEATALARREIKEAVEMLGIETIRYDDYGNEEDLVRKDEVFEILNRATLSDNIK